MKAKLLFHILDTRLGEGPVWDHRSQKLWWVDIKGHLLHVYHPDKETHRSYAMGQFIGSAVPCKDSEKLIVGLHQGIGFFDPNTEELEIFSDPESHLPDNRFNDGKCDPVGRFWTGSMRHESPREPEGALYCIDQNLSIAKKFSPVTISNGLAWSKDARKMFYIDTSSQKVRAFDYEIKDAGISNEKSVVQFEGENYPDGMCIDVEDNLWVAFYGKAKVCCYDSLSGKQLARIDVPANRITSCCFGGPDMDTLFITSAREKGDPHGGAVFNIKPGITGPLVNFFEGG